MFFNAKNQKYKCCSMYKNIIIHQGSKTQNINVLQGSKPKI